MLTTVLRHTRANVLCKTFEVMGTNIKIKLHIHTFTWRDQKNNYKNVFLVTESWSSTSSKAWTTTVLYGVIVLNSWLTNVLTEQINTIIHGETVLWEIAVTAHGCQVKASLAAYIASVCQTNSKWFSLYVSIKYAEAWPFLLCSCVLCIIILPVLFHWYYVNSDKWE